MIGLSTVISQILVHSDELGNLIAKILIPPIFSNILEVLLSSNTNEKTIIYK